VLIEVAYNMCIVIKRLVMLKLTKHMFITKRLNRLRSLIHQDCKKNASQQMCPHIHELVMQSEQ